ncbi:SAM hydrolase/SAM-dependent halogenase family protein [Egbenema bharatensis]|uniref:SAM hydrolase/SAM-dependent halogenase family protein n=1 Tax=Egbenema bharatensis TaxID=3463334 RepID=UPI003A8B1407
MTSYPILTLLSDFGWNDVYVGVMKGVIAQINPQITIVDLTHEIPPQNITAAQFNLLNAYSYFPEGTVHVAVVDPGVGGMRRAIALQLATGILIGPDNGIFTGFLQQPILHVVELNSPQYWRVPNPSNTFHGRDIFAPVAAHIASGVPFTQIGNPIDPATLLQQPIPPCTATPTGFTGTIQHIDRFGNSITTIPGEFVQGKAWSVQISKRSIPGQSIPGHKTYSDVPPGTPLALIGSHGWIEIAINSGDAGHQLRLDWNDRIEVRVEENRK